MNEHDELELLREKQRLLGKIARIVIVVTAVALFLIIGAMWWFSDEQAASRFCKENLEDYALNYSLCMERQGYAP